MTNAGIALYSPQLFSFQVCRIESDHGNIATISLKQQHHLPVKASRLTLPNQLQ